MAFVKKLTISKESKISDLQPAGNFKNLPKGARSLIISYLVDWKVQLHTPPPPAPFPGLGRAPRHIRRLRYYYLWKIFYNHQLRRKWWRKEQNKVLEYLIVIGGKDGWFGDAKQVKRMAFNKIRNLKL